MIRACDALILNPRRLQSLLWKQGIGGPPPALVVGNILQMNKARSQVPKQPQEGGGVVHNCVSFLFPAFEQWAKQYGTNFSSSYILPLWNFLWIFDPRSIYKVGYIHIFYIYVQERFCIRWVDAMHPLIIIFYLKSCNN